MLHLHELRRLFDRQPLEMQHYIFLTMVAASLVLMLISLFSAEPLRYGIAALVPALLAIVYDPARS